MWKIFEIGTNISTPLALSGFIAAIVFFILKQIINKNIYPKLTKQLTSSIIQTIINKLFILSIFSLFLGFTGWLFNSINRNRQETANSFQAIEGIIIINNKEYDGVAINILELEKSVKTNSFGKFIVLINSNIITRYDSLTFKISLDNLKLDTLLTVQKKDYLKDIRFTFSIPKTQKTTVRKSENPFSSSILNKIREAENYYNSKNITGKNSAAEIYFEISNGLTKNQLEYLPHKELLLKAGVDYKNREVENALQKYYEVFHPLIIN